MKKILIDADPGHDDAIAIMFAATSTELNILGITCVAGNATLNNTVINALKICTFINRKDIKIYLSDYFSDFSLYGSWEGLVVWKSLRQGPLTISTPGKPNSDNLSV